MDGKIIVTYRILCQSDLSKEISLSDLFENEKVVKAIKSEFAKGFRNIELVQSSEDVSVRLESTKELHRFEVTKDDFADILALAEDEAISKKLLKKDCDRVELVNIETVEI